MKKKIIILGAAYFAREVYSMVLDCIANGSDWEFKGFLDDRVNLLEDFPHQGEMLGSVDDYFPTEDEWVIPALGDSGTREIYVRKLEEKGARFETLIHPSAIVGAHVEIGKGCVITQLCVLTADIKIGNFVNIGVRTTLSHGNKIGDFATMAGHCCIAGEVSIGCKTFVGCSVTVVPRKQIGDNAYLCAGSVVIRNVKDGVTVLGNPARKCDIRGLVCV